jgi:UDP-N-acetylmuramate--L-alanine ligase
MMALVTPAEPVPLSELGRVHFVAIGGAGMSGIARIMLARGLPVSGCDARASAQLEQLEQLGAQVSVGHSAAHADLADTLVVSSAIRADNPEVVAARQRGILVLHRAAALASVMIGRQAIAVAGTHGKTTTTSMITTVLRHGGADPSYVIGGVLAETGVGAAQGTGAAFVAEADESDGSFLMLAPDAAIVTCIEADHLDNYGSLSEIEDAFAAFAGRIRPGGLLVTDADDPGARRLAARAAALPLRQVCYGESAAADYRLADVRSSGMATEFSLVHAGGAGGTGGAGRMGDAGGAVGLRIGVPGRHNARNAAAVYALTSELGYGKDEIVAGLAAYSGAERRMELKGEAGQVRVLDSYAHHPTEIAADLAAAADIAAGDGSGGASGGRVIAIFQPHLYSRTRIFAAQFAAALAAADEVFVLDVYAAREDPEPGVTGALISDAVPGGRAIFVPGLDQAPDLIADLAKPGDVILTMGAGDVTTLGPRILAALAERYWDSGSGSGSGGGSGEPGAGR